MDITARILYPALPFMAWVVSGTLKYAVNRVRHGKDARRLIGNGGFPSTHTSVVSSVTMLTGFDQGFETPMFGLGIALTYIVMIDAVGIRRAVGDSAKWINKLVRDNTPTAEAGLRERQGHTRLELLGGLAVGTLLGWAASLCLSLG